MALLFRPGADPMPNLSLIHISLELYKGNIEVTGRQSPTSLYRPDIASFTMGAGYQQKDAEGFIRILGLPARSRALVQAESLK